MSQVERDDVTGVDTTGHEWDGVKELNNPLPRWWLSIFYATVIWSIGYCIVYPAWPMITEATKGVLGYSSRAELQETMAEAAAAQSVWRDRIAAASLDEIRGDQQLSQYAMEAGRAAFAVNCSQCHGAGAQGFPGYPNLNDDAWLWGGDLEQIHTTITHGVRNATDPDARYSEMPAFGEFLSSEEIDDLAQYVLQLGDLDHDRAAAARGEPLYVDNCAACHGDTGAGDRELGAPRLADAIWLFAGDDEAIEKQISAPAHGVMPAWGQRLDATTIKELAIYVHALGGGE